MSSIKAQAGDTFESISIRLTGVPTNAVRIKAVNANVSLPIKAGVTINVPTDLIQANRVPVLTEDEGVVVIIDGTRFRFWEQLSITRSFDSVSTFAFTAPLSPDEDDFRKLIAPFSYHSIEVFVGNKRIINGTLLNTAPRLSKESATVAVEGYSLPGVLMDCTPPAGQALQFTGVTFREIARTLAGSLGVKTTIDNLGAPVQMPIISLNIGQKIFPFLANLARQHGIIMSDDAEGSLVLKREREANVPVANLKQGQSPVKEVKVTFKPQNYYSEVTAVGAFGLESLFLKSDKLGAAKGTVKNPKLSTVIRPMSTRAAEVNPFDIKASVEQFTSGENIKGTANAKIARMFAEAVEYEVIVQSWFDPQGDLWEPGSYIKLEAPYAFIYNPYVFLVRDVTFKKDNMEYAVLKLTFPGVFNSKIPEVLPWEA